MKPGVSWKLVLKKKNSSFDGVKYDLKMRQLPFMVVICVLMLFIIHRTTKYQISSNRDGIQIRLPLDTLEETKAFSWRLRNLPRGIVHARSNLEMRPLWSSSTQRSKVDLQNDHVEASSRRYLLSMPVGIKQMRNVDTVVQKFLPANFTIMLFHYDGKVDAWGDLDWNDKAIHAVALYQTKWWFAKRFLHPSVVNRYDYVFLWDEDLELKNFCPESYLEIVRSEGLEISQPAQEPNSMDIHHRITMQSRSKKFHR